ncbi:MAG: MarR family transcriptional regulator [Rubrivivax sp.]|nr:MarR family transcriptional regulator [Rubrivivax sp.]
MAAERFVDHYLAALLAQANSLISTEFHQVVKQQGLQVPEWRLLASLAGGEAISVGRLAQITLAQQPTVTRQLDRMQKKGLIQRIEHRADRRVTLALITASGQALADKLIGQALAHEQRVLSPFGAERAALLKTTLREIIDAHRVDSER